jgi:hypothetical protein
MRLSSALASAFCVGAIALLHLGAEASRHHSTFAPASFGKEEPNFTHEPDFGLIEKIYKRGQLRSAAVRKRTNVDALPADSPNWGPGPILTDLRLVWDLYYPDYNCPYG